MLAARNVGKEVLGEPITLVLRNLYPGADVRWVAGRQEYGADVVVQLVNHFGGLPWLIVVQVKNYSGEIGPAVPEQLKTAHGRYSTEGKILCLVVMTTAEQMSADLAERAHALEMELTTPVKFVAPGSVYTASVGDHGNVGLCRLEVGCSPGTGKLTPILTYAGPARFFRTQIFFHLVSESGSRAGIDDY